MDLAPGDSYVLNSYGGLLGMDSLAGDDSAIEFTESQCVFEFDFFV